MVAATRTWDIAIGMDHGTALLSIQSSDMVEPSVIDITDRLDELIEALQRANRKGS